MAGHSPAREIVDLLVSEQHLDDADALLLFEQMSRETMAQRVHRHALVDVCRLSGVTGNRSAQSTMPASAGISHSLYS